MNRMTRLIVTADIHGSYSSWLTIKNILKPSDKLVIAGDLFDTKYGNYSSTDFQPESIKKDLSTFKYPFYYVYGNCDTPPFFPGYNTTKQFTEFNKNILLYHGHQPPTFSKDVDIIIQGHTHLCFLEKKADLIFMNPGSITSSRNNMVTYGMIDNASANLIDLKTGNTLIRIDF